MGEVDTILVSLVEVVSLRLKHSGKHGVVVMIEHTNVVHGNFSVSNEDLLESGAEHELIEVDVQSSFKIHSQLKSWLTLNSIVASLKQKEN